MFVTAAEYDIPGDLWLRDGPGLWPLFACSNHDQKLGVVINGPLLVLFAEEGMSQIGRLPMQSQVCAAQTTSVCACLQLVNSDTGHCARQHANTASCLPG